VRDRYHGSALREDAEGLLDDGLRAGVEARRRLVQDHDRRIRERADRIAVLESGRLVELGSHDELLAQGGLYAAMWDAWEAGAPGELVRS
jgi:ABC-type multidrug transport system fused ATPase/permease subunit